MAAEFTAPAVTKSHDTEGLRGRRRTAVLRGVLFRLALRRLVLLVRRVFVGLAAVVASNTKAKAQHKSRAFSSVELHFGRSGGFRFPVDGAFGDLGQGRIGLLFFSESLIQKPDRTA